MDYRTTRWERMRERVLRKNRYLCRECQRYGRRIQANTAHHAWPASKYPEYAWSEWNLVPLCSACHNAMHDRITNELTELGEYWRRKIRPPAV